MDVDKYIKICSIEKKENDVWNFYDCNDGKLRSPLEKGNFTSAMKKRYYKNKQERTQDISTVWVLVCYGNDDRETWEQVTYPIHCMK